MSFAASPAFGQDADALLAEGKKLMKEGKLAEACPKLEESQKNTPRSSTLLEVAACHEKQGKLATAWSEYIDVAADARKEGNRRLEADAKRRGARLELKLPRVTISVPANAASAAGFEVKLDGAPLDKSGWGQSRPIDPGEHTITASATGKKTWEYAVKVKVAERKAVSVPALADDPSAAAAAAAPAAAAPVEAPQKVEPKAPADEAAAAAPEVEAPVTTHQAGRIVFDIGVAGGLLFGIIERSAFEDAATYRYQIPDPAGELIAACDPDVCYTAFDPSLGGLIGGQVFVGYALKEDLQLGGRFLGGYRFGGGYFLAGGPSGSMKVGPVWLGLTLLVGGVLQDAPIVGIKGEIPEEFIDINQGQTEVEVDFADANIPESELVGTLAFGGTIELSYPLVDLPSSSWTSGALMVSFMPTFMKGLEGFAIVAPVNLGYRFY